jgi:two-component system response regulator AtoC
MSEFNPKDQSQDEIKLPGHPSFQTFAPTHLKALIVDDEADLRASIRQILDRSIPNFAFTIGEARTGVEAVKMVKTGDWDLVLMDVRMPEMDGMEALKQIKEEDPRIFVVLITAHANLQDAVEAIKQGAYDYVEKPLQISRLTEIVQKANGAREMVSGLAISNPIFDDDIDSEFVGSSKKMREIFHLIYRLCKVDTTVLIRGENGTGKELVARAIHYNSHRKDGPFVAINCGAIPETLIESELFGHEKGAFTGATERKIGKFQLANQGTLFLDEIAELRPEMQVKLLRVLQERKFTPVGSNREVKTGTRVIAATNRNLEKMIEEQKFREDLFYRLNVMPIFLPPLRDRLDDVEDLVEQFIKKFSRLHSREITGIDQKALGFLRAYQWPGNIRELENVIEHAFVVENSNRISIESLPEAVRSSVRSAQERDSTTALNFEVFKEQVEKDFILKALRANNGRINQTVAHANIPKNTLLRKIKKYAINVKELIPEKPEKK